MQSAATAIPSRKRWIQHTAFITRGGTNVLTLPVMALNKSDAQRRARETATMIGGGNVQAVTHGTAKEVFPDSSNAIAAFHNDSIECVTLVSTLEGERIFQQVLPDLESYFKFWEKAVPASRLHFENEHGCYTGLAKAKRYFIVSFDDRWL
ncbi:MAG: hypothetical protein V3T17_01005 [Pseudomonadales bacterium]